ncbi:MAG: hypothetical protein WCJ98_14340, partial [Mycobacteriaceae bacterium]
GAPPATARLAGAPPDTARLAGAPPDTARLLTVPLVRAGAVLAAPNLDAARELVARGLRSLPWEGLALSRGEPAIPTRQVAPQ